MRPSDAVGILLSGASFLIGDVGLEPRARLEKNTDNFNLLSIRRAYTEPDKREGGYRL